MEEPRSRPENLQMRNGRGIKIFIQACGVLFALFIIAAILFTFFAKGTSGSGRSCQGNIKQLGLAIQLYQQDFDGMFPPGTYCSGVSSTRHDGVGWGGQIYPDAKSTVLYRCPSEEKTDSPITRVSYGYNINIPRSGVAFGGLQTPAHIVLLFEVANAFADVTRPDEGASQGATKFSPVGDGTSVSLRNGLDRHTVIYATGNGGNRPNLSGTWPPARHQDGAVYLLADGHAKWFRPGQVSTGSDAVHSRDNQTGASIGRAAGTSYPGYSITFSTK